MRPFKMRPFKLCIIINSIFSVHIGLLVVSTTVCEKRKEKILVNFNRFELKLYEYIMYLVICFIQLLHTEKLNLLKMNSCS